jgi:hypothetical protein
MKTLELSGYLLNEFGMQEMSNEQLTEIEGGFWASGSTWFWRGFGIGLGAGAGAATAFLV